MHLFSSIAVHLELTSRNIGCLETTYQFRYPRHQVFQEEPAFQDELDCHHELEAAEDHWSCWYQEELDQPACRSCRFCRDLSFSRSTRSAFFSMRLMAELWLRTLILRRLESEKLHWNGWWYPRSLLFRHKSRWFKCLRSSLTFMVVSFWRGGSSYPIRPRSSGISDDLACNVCMSLP